MYDDPKILWQSAIKVNRIEECSICAAREVFRSFEIQVEHGDIVEKLSGDPARILQHLLEHASD